jgi:protein-S-isoprenylcysteine O-methyltransferase Ste14
MASPRTIDLGNVLFRFRSFTPVPVIALALFLLWRSRGAPGPGGPAVDAALDLAGLGSALVGQALRFYTLGLVPEGTSGQGNALQAVTLNTRGPYAFVRNPLYVGNLGICLGLLLIAHDPWVHALGLGFFFGEYFFIIRAEESFLRGRFAEAFDAFCQRVPRWVPRLTPAYEGPLRHGFDVRRALKKEHNPFAAWATGALVLWGWETWARGALGGRTLWLLVGLQAAVLLLFVGLKGWKHRWLQRLTAPQG